MCSHPPLIVSCQSSQPYNSTASSTDIQTAEEHKTLDEQYLEIAEQIPSFAGIYEGNDGVLVAKIAQDPALTAQQTSDDSDVTVPEVREAILEVMGQEVFTGVPNDLADEAGSPKTLQATSSPSLRLEDTKYTFKQLHTWLWQTIDLDLDGVMIYDANEGNNNVYLGVETRAQAEATKARIAKLPIPPNAVAIEVVGPYKDYVLRGEGLQKYLAQEAKTAEVQLQPAAVQYVDGPSVPLVGGVRVTTDRGGCTYGFSAKRNGVLGLVTNFHCTANKAQVDGDIIRQNQQYIGVETVDPPPRWCGIVWGDCRYSDAAFFKNTSSSTVRVATPRIAGTGPGAGDRTYDYSSPVLGILSSTKQNEHYIAVTSKTGFTRLVVTNTCTYLRTGIFDISAKRLVTIECGAVAKPESPYPNVQQGDSGSPVITRNSSGAMLAGEIFGGNPLNGGIWMNNMGGILRDLGSLTVRW